MPAIILQHHRAPVTFDPPLHPEPEFHPVSEGDMARLDGAEAVCRLVAEHGAETVARWLRFAAHLNGEAI